MKLFKMFKRGQKGFTLVELMVVMAIMALLATIVVPAVTGTKGTSENAQIGGDTNSVQSAVAKFNNDSTSQAWPEMFSSNVTSYTMPTLPGVTVATITDPRVNGYAANTYTVVDWTKATNIRLGSGALQSVAFVPDYVPQNPASVGLLTGATGSTPVYIWVLKIGAATDAPTRTVEVYKFDGTTNAYAKVK